MIKGDKLKFPSDFLWGVATSAYQIEGGIENDWSRWEHLKSIRLAQKFTSRKTTIPGWNFLRNQISDPKNYLSAESVDHWNRVEQDLDLLTELNVNSYRFSIEWARVEPEQGKFDAEAIAKYAHLAKSLKQRSIVPFVTLYHFTLPTWIADKGGWENRETIDHFLNYVEHMVSCCIEAKMWITINEPEIYARDGYLTGRWPPGKHSPIAYFRVINNLIEAHRLASQIIKRVNPQAQVGIAKNNTYFQPYKNRWINKLLVKPISWWWNRYFLNRVQNDLDFIGLNYYFHRIVSIFGSAPIIDPVSDTGDELGPYGIFHALTELKRYGLPVYVTENGLADARDEKREWYIKQTLINIYHAMDEGLEIKGYFHWSLLDNFEWDKGFWAKYGLYSVDRESFQRKRRNSASFYAAVAATGEVVV